jgi:hypothetical protein
MSSHSDSSEVGTAIWLSYSSQKIPELAADDAQAGGLRFGGAFGVMKLGGETMVARQMYEPHHWPWPCENRESVSNLWTGVPR